LRAIPDRSAGMRHPVADAAPTGQTVLVWGGSTSVGSNAIQLAVAAGYEVITMSSPRNFEYVTPLGASQGLTTTVLASCQTSSRRSRVARWPG
jgi:NADPH:quinone reductase-like Zn-dependent oxidoreductase